MTSKNLMDILLKYKFSKLTFLGHIQIKLIVTKVIKLTTVKNEWSALDYNALILQ